MKQVQSKWVSTVLMLMLLALGLTRALDQYSHDFTSEALGDVAITYASVRALNAAISVAQGTTVSVGVSVGVGGNASFAPGQALDPLNDLVERFSWVILMSMTSLGIQKLLLAMMSSGFFNVVMILAAAWYLLTLWRDMDPPVQHRALQVCTLFLFLRFAIAATVIANSAVEAFFLSEPKAAAESSIQQTTDEIERKTSNDNLLLEAEEDDSAFGAVVSAWSAVKSGAYQVKRQMVELTDDVESGIEAMLELIALFVIQTIILPLAFLWAFYWGIRSVVEWGNSLARSTLGGVG